MDRDLLPSEAGWSHGLYLCNQVKNNFNGQDIQGPHSILTLRTQIQIGPSPHPKRRKTEIQLHIGDTAVASVPDSCSSLVPRLLQ